MPQQPELSGFGVRSFLLQACPTSAGAQGFALSADAIQGHKLGPGPQVKQPGPELTPKWDASDTGLS